VEGGLDATAQAGLDGQDPPAPTPAHAADVVGGKLNDKLKGELVGPEDNMLVLVQVGTELGMEPNHYAGWRPTRTGWRPGPTGWYNINNMA